MSIPPHDLDVRPILQAGGEPFSAIMEAVAALAPGQSLRLLASFKPVPLFQVMGSRGFEPSAREIGGGDWEVLFTPQEVVPAPQEAPSSAQRSAQADAWPTPTIEIDNRDLEPPEPMVLTLQALETLAPGQTLAALMPREPLFLFTELEQRGHRWQGVAQADGTYRLVIRAGGAGEA